MGASRAAQIFRIPQAVVETCTVYESAATVVLVTEPEAEPRDEDDVAMGTELDASAKAQPCPSAGAAEALASSQSTETAVADLGHEGHQNAVNSVRDAIDSGVLDENATLPRAAEGLDFVSPVCLNSAGQAVQQTQEEVDAEVANLPSAPAVFHVDLRDDMILDDDDISETPAAEVQDAADIDRPAIGGVPEVTQKTTERESGRGHDAVTRGAHPLGRQRAETRRAQAAAKFRIALLQVAREQVVSMGSRASVPAPPLCLQRHHPRLSTSRATVSWRLGEWS